MYNKSSVLFGILVFIGLATAPIWLNLSGGKADYKPNPVVITSEYQQCVADKEYMNHYHMDMLNQWRDKVVRFDERIYKKEDGTYFMLDGKPAEMSLSHTCMNCHANKEDFCDQCHNYLDVKPYCWDCHVEPSMVKRKAPLTPVLQQNPEVITEQPKEATNENQ